MLLALLVTAQLGTAAPAEEAAEHGSSSGRRHPCASVVVTSPQARPGRSSFSVTKILDLELLVQLQPLPAGPHLLELKLYTPRGHLYEVLPLTFEGTRSTKTRAGGAEPQRVVARLPVAGTSIVAASLFGRWYVDVHLDGAPQSCGIPTRFRLTP
jgi:hypothetical protein